MGGVIRNDFLMRLIQQLAETIGRALGLAKKGQTEEAQKLLDEALRTHVGMPYSMLEKLPPEEIARLLGPEKCMIIAAILDARAEVDRAPELAVRAAAIRQAAGLPQ